MTLIERLQDATGPDRALDAEIAQAVGLRGKERKIYKRGHYIGGMPVLLRIAVDYLPFTKSLDAAMTLVPEGWTGCLDAIGTSHTVARFGPKDSDDEVCGEHATPAIALCIAALKARGI